MNKRKALISGMIALVSMFLLGIVFAATSSILSADKNYAINVIDDGSQTVTTDENIQLQTKIVNSSDKEITLETSVKNLNVQKTKQVCIVLDTSYSMDVNGAEYDIKTTAKDLVDNILNNVASSSISIVDTSGVKTQLITNKTTLQNAITAASGGNDVSDALNNAMSVLKPSDTVETYVIILSDATDNAKEELQALSENGTKVYSLLTGITSTSFGNTSSPVPEDGTVYMIDNFNPQDIVNDMNKAMKNVSMKNIFNQEILKSSTKGNFTVEILNNETDGTAIQNEDGSIDWNAGIINRAITKKVRYKLTLNTTATIGTDSIYNDIKVIDKMTVKYTPYNRTSAKQLILEDGNPTIQICDAYDLEINAIGKDTTIPVEGVKFDVTGINEEGKTIVKQTGLVSDSNGNVTIKTIKQLGKINFTITPRVDGLIGYDKTDAVNVIVDNQYTASGGNLTVSYFDTNKASKDDSNGKRAVTIEVPIELQKFNFVVDVSDLSDPDSKLPGIDFRLIQPKLNNKYEMQALYGTTDNNGRIQFDASIMSVAGTYEYILSQMSDKYGYENIGNVTIRVTFDNDGKVIQNGVETLYNSNVEGSRPTDSTVLLKVKEKCNSSNTFNIKLNLSDADTGDKIEGTIYDFSVTKINNDSSANDTMTYTKVTDSEGNISFKSIASGSGYTKIVIHENTANNAYVKETTDKEIIINRQGGIIHEITFGGDYTIKDPDNNNGIIVNLTNKKKSEINLIRMHLTQKDDTGLNLINVPMELKNVTPNGEGEIYNEITDTNGYAEFTLKDPATIKDGTYYFEIRTNPTPMGYYEPDVVPTIKVSVINGRITDIIDVTNTGVYMPITNCAILNESDDKTVTNIAYSDFALTTDVNNTSYVKVKLVDADDNSKAISNGKYEIRMERDGAQIANAGSTGKYTGLNGYTNKMSIPGLDSNPVTITISQVYDATRQNGYKIDKNVYKMVVRKADDGSIQIDSATLEDGSELPVGLGTSFEDNNSDGKSDTAVFNHTNTILNPGDVLLNFSIVKYDYITKLPDQCQDLMVWSDDFKIYDETTKNYETFDINNPYNPFKTGINSTSNSSSGQIDIKLKPSSLPKVEDTNVDGYPIGGAVLHIGEFNTTTGEIIEGTEYQIEINFTYSKETGTYKYSGYSNLSNWNLLKNFHHSTSANSGEGYVESAVLELWSNYGETANFGIDFSKFNYLGEELPGAQYSVKIALPTGKYINLTQDVINGEDTVEIPNAYVKQGTIITIKEHVAPIGYEIDTQEAAFIIDKIDSSTGVATISDYGVKNKRITLDGYKVTNDNAGNLKFIQKIKLVDLEKNNVKFGITTKDVVSSDPTIGNSYKIVTNTGASAISEVTNEEGNVTTLIGGEKTRDYMEYTISQNLSDSTEVARFYKRLANDINVKVFFDDNGNIDNDPTSPNYYGTLCSQVDSNYGTTWYIDSVNDKNKINVVILQNKQDPLNVNFKTVDKFTGATLTSITDFKITPTYELSGEGTTSAQVGYVDPNKAVTYTVKTNVKEKYIGIKEQQFIVEYDENGNITKVTVTPESTSLAVSKNTSNSKTVDLTITIEPAVPFVIHNIDYYTKTSLQNGTFVIEREDGIRANSKSTDDNGNAILYNGEFGTGTAEGNKTYIYTVKQSKAAHTYATVEDFKIAVEYDSNRNIVAARVYEETVSTNKFITVSFKQPSVSSDLGYNGNNKGIVNIEVKNYPAFYIEFTNEDRINSNKKLQGAKYSIISSIPTSAQTNGTDVDGKEISYVDRTTFGTTVTYEITETQPANGYQKLGSKIKVEVDFDSNGYVNIAGTNPVRIIEGADYANALCINPVTTNAENFAIRLTVRSSPIFRINIDNIDRKDYNNGTTTNLEGAKYSITSDYGTSAEIVKSSQDAVVAMLGETPLNGYITYTIKEIEPEVRHQTIEKDIIMKVHFDINGCVDSVSLDNANNAYATASAVTNIVNSEDNFTVNLTIRNNPLIALNLNKANEDGVPLNNVAFSVEGKIKGTNDIIFSQSLTTISGLGAFRIDRALDNKTIVYTIRETKNAPGYLYMPSELTLEITYDSEGRIAKNANGEYLAKLTPQANWINLNSVDDYGLDISVVNERIKDIGINLNTIDKYDDNKKAEKAEIKAYFTKNGASYTEDENHSIVLITGRDTDNDGTPDLAHGQDYQTIGKAENIIRDEIEGIQTATLVLKELKTPNTYYDVDKKVSKDNMYMSWSYYGLSSARINLTFTDEGKIDSARLVPDALGNTVLGKCLDSQYISVSVDESNPYMLNINLRYYPMLEMTINAVSDDTYARTANNTENDLIATYSIRAQHYDDKVTNLNNYNTNLRNGLVTAGYIGANNSLGGTVPGATTRNSKVFNTVTGTYEANHYALWVGEQLDINNQVDIDNKGRIRYVYVYEPGGSVSEPANNYSGYEQLQYQQHGQQDYSTNYASYNNNLIGAIQVTYDIKGEISDVTILENKGANSDNRTEQADNSKYITAEISDNKHGIIVKIQYKRTTTIQARVTDNITGAELTNITLSPCLGGTVNTNRFYNFTNSAKERNLGKGQDTWTYWGGNDANGDRRYVIGTRFNNATMYNGYDSIGNVELDIHYDEYGFIDIQNSRVLSTNADGQPNAVIESVDKDKVYINIIASRRFNMQIDKKDYFDGSRIITDARFSITSSKTDIKDASGKNVNVKNNITQGTMNQIGLVHANETVTYTISETFTPAGYQTIDDFDMDVVFDENGVISKIILEDGTVLYDVFGIHESKNIPIKLISVSDKFNGLKPQNITDLRIELGNIPKLETNITLRDQFYTNEVIEGVTYSITNNTYNVSATGNPTTDASGKISTYVGTVYPKETVRYTIKQTMTVPGYYAKKSDIVVDVTFDDNGYISDYVVVQGNDEQTQITMLTSKRGFNLIIYNKPKDIKIGIEKYDQLTNEKLEGVGFKITTQEIGSSTIQEFNAETEVNGNITETVDTFLAEKEVLYTISETKQLDGYRRIDDIVIRVKYNTEGKVDYYNVDSNPSNAFIEVANSSFKTLANGDDVHIKVTIPNNDSYDLIVRDEDKSIDNLGVSETVYNISINGVEQEPLVTDASGYVSLVNRRENGDVNIKVSEASIGTGYRANALNSADLKFIKGVQTYSLDLDVNDLATKGYTLISGPDDTYHTNYKDGELYTIQLDTIDNTQVIVGIYENTGKITVTFKNESKQMLNLTKIDAQNSQIYLEGAEFEIVSQEVDSFGNLQGAPTTITASSVTDEDGKIYIDLGQRPQSKKIRYTFKELTPPEGYVIIEDTSITCTYDGSGRITSKEKNSKRIGADDSWYDLNVSIKNGNIDTYSIKIISVDSRKGSTATGQSNSRINGSKFDITVTDSNNSTIKELKDVQTQRTADSFGYFEEGVITIPGFKAEGTITVNINQTGLVDGFTRGDNITTGVVTFENIYVKNSTTSNPEISLSNLNYNGFIDSYIDENENQIVIKVYNDPQVKLNLHKTNIDTGAPIEGVTFTITSEIDGQNRVATVPTELNVTTLGTDKEGNEVVNIGAPEYGKTVIYTIHENKVEDYNQIDDIKVRVTYDTAGKINDFEVLSDETYSDVRDLIVRINEKDDWRIFTEEELKSLQGQDNVDIVNTRGSRKLNMAVKNKPSDKAVPYTMIVEPQDELGNPVPGISLELNLSQGKGENPKYPVKTTDEAGHAIYTADGSDRLEIKIDIIDSKSYSFNSNLSCIIFKNSSTGEMNITENNNIYPEIDNENHIIKLVVLCKTANDKYNISLLKMDKASNTTILDNPATFTITRKENISVEIPEGEDSSDETLGGDTTVEQTSEDTSSETPNYIEQAVVADRQTNNSGMLSLPNLDMPSEIGTYTYRVYEKESPEGYKELEEPVEIDVTFGYNELGNKVITDVVSKDTNSIYIAKKGETGFVMCVNNSEVVPNDQYMLNVFKIDSETQEKLNGAIFKVKLADENGTYVYTESGENTDRDGQLDYCYIEQNKDYEVRLKQMARPTVNQIKSSGSSILTHTYTFQEVAAPDGYALDKTEVSIKIEFEIVTDEDGNEKVQIRSAESDNVEILRINSFEADQVNADILNKEEANSYTVHYDGNTTDNVMYMPADQIKLAGSPLTIDANIPTREGYTFVEWNTEIDGSGTSFPAGGTYAIDADVTLYAKWKTTEYTVHYEPNAPIDENTGVAIGLVTDIPVDQIKTHNVDLTLDSITPKIPNLSTYYEFESWNTAQDGSGTSYESSDIYNINSDVTLYAQWNYIIHYIANVPVDTDGFPMGTANNIPTEQYEKVNDSNDAIIDSSQIYANAPTMDGYKFKEWNTKADGTGDTYNPNDVYTSKKGMELYAIWQYEIIYNENIPIDSSGFVADVTINNMPASPQVENASQIVGEIPAIIANTTDNPNVPTTTPDNYTFKEWNTKADGTGDSYNPDDSYNGNIGITLYAIWEEKVVEEDLYLKSDVYIIGNEKPSEYNDGDETQYEDGDKYILGIMPKITANKPEDYNSNNEGTTIAQFKNNIITNAEQIKIYDQEGTEITDEESLVVTEATLELTKGNETIRLTLIVRGDFKDGVLKLNDYNQLGNYLSKGTSTIINTEAILKAFDVNLDGKINMRDYNLMANALSSIDNTVLK